MKPDVDQTNREVFGDALRLLQDSGIDFVVGGAYALSRYTDIWRNTKDMDLLLLESSVERALRVLAEHGYKTWIEADFWIAKATKQGYLVDLIFGSGNWLQQVDQLWFERAQASELFGIPIRYASVEDMIWSKAYVAVRHRYDGSDIMHLIEAQGHQIDWSHLLKRFGRDWELLFSYLILFRFVYPSERNRVPQWVISELIKRTEAQFSQPAPTARICRGTLLDRFGYLVDIEKLGYIDARVRAAEKRGYDADVVAEDRRKAERFLENQQPN